MDWARSAGGMGRPVTTAGFLIWYWRWRSINARASMHGCGRCNAARRPRSFHLAHTPPRRCTRTDSDLPEVLAVPDDLASAEDGAGGDA